VIPSQKAQVQAQFGPSARDYVTSAGHAGGDDLERLVAWGRKRGAARVLDVATGGGHAALAFSAFTASVVSTDLTLPMLEAARDFIREKGAANVRFLASDVESLPFRDASFGVVTCRLAAHHFPAILPAMKEMARVLRPGGSILKAAGLTVIDEGTLTKARRWEEWTARMRMTPEAKADLERFVKAAPERCREAFCFTIENGRIQTFSDRLTLIRADRD
jgi:ubiquinone/menaquinone biosynthesis C-methylase UbiE